MNSIDKYIAFLVPIATVYGYPLAAFLVLKVYRKDLNKPNIKAKVSGFYANIDLNRNPENIFHYPVYLVRRFIFVHIAFVFNGVYDYSYIAIQSLIVLNMLSCCYYFKYRPHIGHKKQGIEMFNEVIIVILSYHMLLFTDFIPMQDKEI